MTASPPPADANARLRVETIEIPDPGPLLGLLPSDRRALFSWVRGGEGLVGWGALLRVDTGGPTRFTHAQEWWSRQVAQADVDDRVRLPGSGPVAFASFAFADDSPAGGSLVVPRVVIGHRDGRWWRTDLRLSTDTEPGPSAHRPHDAPRAPGATTVEGGSLGPTAWREVVAEAVRRIRDGHLDKVVLARDVVVRAQSPIDPRHVLERLARDYDRTWVFSVDGLIGATPEMLVRLERGLVTSRVLAGTIRRTGTPAHDEHDLAIAASLARSSKDLEEHEYAVRSVAEALAPYCASMNVPEAPFVLELPNVMHLATDVTGRTRNGSTSLELAAALHPSAAVCGTPRQAAADLIDEVEQLDRGRYAGPVGWIDANGDGDWGIALRCGATDPDDEHRIRLYAGCGIVTGSIPDHEWAESEAKLLPMRAALGSGDLAGQTPPHQGDPTN